MQNDKRLFPKELLTKSKEERESFFNNHTVPHPKMHQVLTKIKKEIYEGQDNIIMIVGPSGVGKSRLFQEIYNQIMRDMAEQIEIDKSIIPVTGIELPNPDLGKFNWKDFYTRVLSSLNEPLIDSKIMIGDNLNNEKKKNVSLQNPGTAPELRKSIEKAFDNRETKALLIDEAQHFFKTTNVINNERQFNSLKSLANMSNAKIVLFGTYDLNVVINLDGQLSRRVKEIHFPRYDYRNANDEKMFRSVVFTFQKLIPVNIEPKFNQYHDYIYENCVGCTGIMKNWLQRCLSDAIENNEETITIDNLQRNALKTRKLITLAEEALLGELDFEESKEDRDELKALLNGELFKIKEVKESKQQNNRTPGKRKPGRDKTG